MSSFQTVLENGNTTSAMIAQDVSVQFATESGTFLALDKVSVEVPANGFTTIIGPSGCGKSTLLRAVADILPTSTGEISVLGGTPLEARKGRKLGFVFQDASLLPWRTVLKNVELPLEVGAGRKAQGNRAADPVALLEMVGLHGRLNAYPRQLSGGMRQRVSIARALASNPQLLLMDEPFGALDEITRDHLNAELLRLWEEAKIAIMFVTHSIPEAIYLSQQVLVLAANPGRVKELVPIDLPYPRLPEVRETVEFARIAAHLRRLLEG